MSRPCSQQESFPRSTLHIGCFPSPVEPFRSLLWHILVGFRGLQGTSWVFSQVLMLQCSHQTARRKHLPVLSPTGHTQTWILENIQQLQLCNPAAHRECLPAWRVSSHGAVLWCPVQVSGQVRLPRIGLLLLLTEIWLFIENQGVKRGSTSSGLCVRAACRVTVWAGMVQLLPSSSVTLSSLERSWGEVREPHDLRKGL